MKKIILLIVILLLSISGVSAGAIYDIDFSKALTHVVILEERDLVRFDYPIRVYVGGPFSTLEEKRNSPYELEEFEQKLMVRNVNPIKESLDLTLFIYGAETPQYFTLARNNLVRVDFERDNIDDLALELYKIEDNKTAIIMQKINVLNKEVKKEVNLWNKIKNFDIKNVYYGIAVILALVLFIKRKKIREFLVSNK